MKELGQRSAVSRRRAAVKIVGVVLTLGLVGLVLGGCERRSRDEPLAISENEQVRNRGEGKDLWWRALPRAAWEPFERLAVSSEWFEVHRVLPGVLAIYEPGQFEEVISYLVLGEERALLFDTGLGIGDLEALVSELTELPIVVLNSHTHYDHVGGNHQFETVWAADTDYTRRSAAGRTHDEVAEFVGEGWIWKPTPPGFRPEDFVGRPFAIADVVEDGTVFDLGGRRLEVVLVPGHAPDSLCLLDRQNRLLFTGDVYYPAPLYAHLEGSDFETYRQSADRLAELAGDVDFLLPGHNEPLLASAALVALHEAFELIASGEASYTLSDGNREYPFAAFSVLTRDPP